MSFFNQKSQTIHKIFFSFVIIFLLSWSFPTQACGCGVLIMGTESGWEYGDDTTEQALISYDKGIENLFIGLEIKSRDKGAVLVTPIPAPPDQTEADILAVSPRFYGYDVVERAEENLVAIGATIIATQIYPLIPLLIDKFKPTPDMMAPGAVIPQNALDQGIEVYQHIEKEGMVAEVLSAKTSDALYNYLTAKGLQVEKDTIPIFKDYIRDDFSFVVAWIDPTKKAVTARGITMSFPTDQIFYPLKPNSAYGGEGREKSIVVIGYVTPKLYDGIEKTTKIEYLYSEHGISSENDDNTIFEDFIGTSDSFGYTQITIRSKPHNMQEDLFISNFIPLPIGLAHAINMSPVIFGLVIFILVALISTWWVRWLVKPQYKTNKPKFTTLVILNCLTLFGTITTAIYYLRTKKFIYVGVFSGSFIMITVLVIGGLINFINI